MKILSFINTKGGVGKTHLSAFLAGLYADMGLRVLMIDADADQASLTQFYEIKHQASEGLVETLTQGTVSAKCVSQTVFDNLDIVCANDANGELRTWLASRMDRAVRMREALRSPFVAENYDVIIIDTKGNGGPMEDAAAFAANTIVSPIVPDIISSREFLSGTIALIEKLEEGRAIGLEPPPVKAVIYRMERTRNAAEVAALLREAVADREDAGITVCQTVVPQAAAFTQAASDRIPLQRLSVNRKRPNKEIEVLHRLAWEIMPEYTHVYAQGCSSFEMSTEEGGQNE